MFSFRKSLWLMPLVVIVSLSLLGCSSEWGEQDDYWSYPGPSYPEYHYLTILLNVSDRDGEPLGGCTVWVDGEAQGNKTNHYFTALGSGPAPWRGWPYNWRLNDYPVRIRWEGDQQTVDVWVTKSDWENAKTSFTIYDWDDHYLWGRATFVMEPDVGLYAQQDPSQGREVESERYPAAQPAPSPEPSN